MRVLLASVLIAACCSVARADTVVDNFTYTYVLNGNTYGATFSLLDGQAPSLSDSGIYTYKGVALNGDAASSASVVFAPETFFAFGKTYLTDGFTFNLFAEAMPGVVDVGTGDGIPIQSASSTGLTFAPGSYSFTSGKVDFFGSDISFDSSSLNITQTVLPDPTPTPSPDPLPSPTTTAVTPEPSSFCLLGTGLLTLATTIRRKLLRYA